MENMTYTTEKFRKIEELKMLCSQYEEAGNYAEAEKVYLEIIEVKGITSGNPAEGVDCVNVFPQMHTSGDQDPIRMKMLGLMQESFRSSYEENARLLAGLAGCHRKMGQTAKAAEEYANALKIYRSLGYDEDSAEMLEAKAMINSMGSIGEK